MLMRYTPDRLRANITSFISAVINVQQGPHVIRIIRPRAHTAVHISSFTCAVRCHGARREGANRVVWHVTVLDWTDLVRQKYDLMNALGPGPYGTVLNLGHPMWHSEQRPAPSWRQICRASPVFYPEQGFHLRPHKSSLVPAMPCSPCLLPFSRYLSSRPQA